MNERVRIRKKKTQTGKARVNQAKIIEDQEREIFALRSEISQLKKQKGPTHV